MTVSRERRAQHALLRAINAEIEKGTTLEKAAELVCARMMTILRPHMRQVAKILVSESTTVTRSLAAARRRAAVDVAKYWALPLATFELALTVMCEIAQDFLERHGPAANRRDDDAFRALGLLHQRAQRITWAVHHVLSGGFALDALARTRTLHELVVISEIIATGAGTSDNADVATRYLDFEAVESLRQADAHQAIRAEWGLTLMSDSELLGLRGRVDQLIGMHGPQFAKADYGWAAKLNGGKVPTFKELEELAGKSDGRAMYVHVCSEVHGGVSGLVLNADDVDERYAKTGPSTVGLAMPGVEALTSMHELTFILLTAGIPQLPSPVVVLYMGAISHLIERFVRQADRAEQRAMHQHVDEYYRWFRCYKFRRPRVTPYPSVNVR